MKLKLRWVEDVAVTSHKLYVGSTFTEVAHIDWDNSTKHWVPHILIPGLNPFLEFVPYQAQKRHVEEMVQWWFDGALVGSEP